VICSIQESGALKLNEQGQIVTSNGYIVQPALNIDQQATGITIAEDGMVSVKLPGQNALTQVGRLQLARFQNQGGLRARGQKSL
jgi:flagellar basal-body rod protein FlgG